MANRNETVEPERDSLSPPPAEAAALDKSLLIVDDDRPFGERLARAMGSRGFTPRVAASVAEGLAAIQAEAPAFAVIDLKLGDGTGLDVMKALKAKRPEAKAIILTGYGAIATAVVAVKLGAYDYLAKPVNADEIVAVLTAERGQHVDGPSIRCRPTGSAGSTSSASTNRASATSRRRRASSTCIGAPCSASSASARRADALSGAGLSTAINKCAL